MNTDIKIVNDGNESSVIFDKHGLLCREYLPYEDRYDDRQMRLLNRGLYLTDDNWKTVKSGIGDFTYYDPIEKKDKRTYGVIADTLIGSLVLSEKVAIYNRDNTIKLDQDGFTLISSDTQSGKRVFRVQRKYTEGGVEKTQDIIYFDDNGNAHFDGTIDTTSIIGNRTIDQLFMASLEFADSTSNIDPPQSGWGENVPTLISGHYVWMRLATSDIRGSRYSNPVCLGNGAGGSSDDVEIATLIEAKTYLNIR